MGVLVVTGSSRGIGAEICRLGAQRDWAVCVNYASSADEAEGVDGAVNVSAAAGPVINIGMGSGVTGGEATVPLSLTKNGPAIVTIALVKRGSLFSYKNPADRDRLLAGLRKARMLESPYGVLRRND